MSKVWNALNSPELVWKVQRLFGIEKANSGDKKFKVGNNFFYYLFLLGTELGDELFYGIFIPVFFFNVDGFVGRRFVFHWFINMYVGQALKDVFIEERPKPPAIQLQSKWSNEYSLPSTHAMASLSIATTILYFARDRYQLDLSIGIVCVVVWVLVISLSRVYLGMHSVLDLIVGAVISLVLLVFLLPITNTIEDFVASSLFSPILILSIPVLLIVYFPITKIWTPTRGDTCSIAAVYSGIELGFWFNYQYGYSIPIDIPYPLSLEVGGFYHLAARTILGLAVAGLTEFIGKYVTYSFLCWAINEDKKVLKESEQSTENKAKIFVDLSSKFITYSVLGFNVIVVVPMLYKYFNIQRNAFFNEM